MCATLIFLLVPPDKILMLSPQSRAYYAVRDIVYATYAADTESDIPGHVHFLCHPLLIGRRIQSRFLDPTIDIMPRWYTVVSF